jgi:hypothetical protein
MSHRNQTRGQLDAAQPLGLRVPTSQPRRQIDPWLQWIPIAALVVVLGSGACARGQVPETKPAIGGSDSTEAPRSDPASMTGQEFLDGLTRVQQMDYAGSKLNANIQEQTNSLNADLDSMGWGDYNYFNRPVVSPNVDNSPQEIWDQISLADHTAWKLAQDGHIDEAKRVASAIAEGQELDELIATFANGGAPVIAVGVGMDASPTITTGEYDGVQANGFGLTRFTKVDATTGDQVKVVVRLTRGTTPDSTRWVLVKILQP